MISETFKFSIIVPVYNEDKTILKVLENLNNLKKYYQNIQIIVINDGSRDDSYYPSLKLKGLILEDETHFTITGALFNRGLRHVFNVK